MNLACRLLCVVVALLPYPAARAANFDLVVGPSFDSGRPTPAAFFSIFGETPRDGHFHFTPIGSAGWIHPRTDHYSNLGRPDNFNHPVFLVAGGVRIVIPDPHCGS